MVNNKFPGHPDTILQNNGNLNRVILRFLFFGLLFFIDPFGLLLTNGSFSCQFIAKNHQW
jgi:hypothetical protein